MKTLSIILPAYNEMNRIEPTIRNYNSYLAETNYAYEIIVADDGSTDDTVDLIKKLQTEIQQLKLVCCETNKGKGQAVRVGMLAAKGDIRIFSDADGSIPITELDKILEPIQSGKAKISIASRYLKGSKTVIYQPLYRRIWSRLANLFVQRLLLPGIVDPNCGFKAFDGKVAERLFSQCVVNEWSFDLEVLGLAHKLNIPIAQIPITWTHDEASKGKLSHLPKEISNLFIIRKRLNKLPLAIV